MSERDAIIDVFAAVVPEDFDLSDHPVARARLIVTLTKIAKDSIWDGYQGFRRPAAIELRASDWLITSNPDDIEEFQPAHDCASCRAGNDQCVAFLREHPTRAIAMANLYYTEVWS